MNTDRAVDIFKNGYWDRTTMRYVGNGQIFRMIDKDGKPEKVKIGGVVTEELVAGSDAFMHKDYWTVMVRV